MLPRGRPAQSVPKGCAASQRERELVADQRAVEVVRQQRPVALLLHAHHVRDRGIGGVIAELHLVRVLRQPPGRVAASTDLALQGHGRCRSKRVGKDIGRVDVLLARDDGGAAFGRDVDLGQIRQRGREVRGDRGQAAPGQRSRGEAAARTGVGGEACDHGQRGSVTQARGLHRRIPADIRAGRQSQLIAHQIVRDGGGGLADQQRHRREGRDVRAVCTRRCPHSVGSDCGQPECGVRRGHARCDFGQQGRRQVLGRRQLVVPAGLGSDLRLAGITYAAAVDVHADQSIRIAAEDSARNGFNGEWGRNRGRRIASGAAGPHIPSRRERSRGPSQMYVPNLWPAEFSAQSRFRHLDSPSGPVPTFTGRRARSGPHDLGQAGRRRGNLLHSRLAARPGPG